MSKEISIIDALNQISVDNVSFQILNKSLIKADKKRDHTALTFATDVTPSELVNNSRVGVIIWMDKPEYDKMATYAKSGGEK